MRYIENPELREWVKESLRKTIFQKAHALAVQTGCEILVKLKDATSPLDCPLYYATETLQKDYAGDGVRQESGDMFVAGETGLPCFPMVDSCTQSTTTSSSETNAEPKVAVTADAPSQTVDQAVQAVEESSAVPMQLSVAGDDAAAATAPMDQQQTMNPKLENVPSMEAGDDSFAQDSLSDVVVKLERLDDEELNQRLGGGGGDVEEEQSSFGQYDNNVSFDGQGDMGGIHTGGQGQIVGRPYTMMSPKPYQCGVCQKAFRSVQVLQKHTQTFHMRPQHAGGRSRGRGRGPYHQNRPMAHRQPQATQARFLCVMCNRSFRTPDLLQDHMTRSHMGHPTPVQLSTSQGTFDPSSAQTSDAPSTATLQSLQQQQQQQSPIVVSSYQSLPITDDQFQMPQAPPQDLDAFNMSDASTSSATFASPSSLSATSTPRTPAFRYQTSGQGRPSTSAAGTPQGTPGTSRGSQHYQRSKDKSATIKTTDIMAAILTMKGPVCTPKAVHKNGPHPVRPIVKSQFLEAAYHLQTAGLGSLVRVHAKRGSVNDVFVKKLPEDIATALEDNPDLCTLTEYSTRFYMRTPASIGLELREELMNLDLVKEALFTEQYL